MFLVIENILDGECVLKQPPDGVDPGHASVVHASRAVTHLEQVRLDVVEVGVEHQVQVGLVGHLGHELLLVHHLANVESLLAQHLSQLLSPSQSLRFIREADNL